LGSRTGSCRAGDTGLAFIDAAGGGYLVSFILVPELPEGAFKLWVSEDRSVMKLPGL
jgi:hypothetical protein